MARNQQAGWLWRAVDEDGHADEPLALEIVGGDDDADLACLCPSCHLRLRHGGFMDVVRVDDALVFLYPGRAVVLR